MTDWQEVVTDEEGVEVSSAFETRRQLLDATTVTGEYTGSSSSGSYSSTYEDKTARRVTEVHLGDEDYEYFFKDQVSGASQTLTSTGQPEQKNRARIHNTLEYEILNKGTENEVFREWAEQSYLRGMMIMTPVNPDGSGGQQPDDSGRTRVGEYAAGAGGPGGVAESGWATDPQATPQAVGSGNNPSSTDGPYGGQGGPAEEEEEEGEGEMGSGGDSVDTGGSAGGAASGSPVTDTTPWEYHEGDVPVGIEGAAINAGVPPMHKPRISQQDLHELLFQGKAGHQAWESHGRDFGDLILDNVGVEIFYVTPWMAENIRDVVGDDVLVNASGNQLVAGTVIVSTGAVVGGYYAAGAGTALAGGNGWAAASSGLGAINTISLANNAASLTIDPTLREGFDTTADLVNMGMTVGGKLLNGRTKYAATILDIGINGAQSAIGVNDAVTSYEAGHEKWAYFQAAMAGLGFAGAGLRFHQEFEVSIDWRGYSNTPLSLGGFDVLQGVEVRPRLLHDVYVKIVRPGAKERVLETPWSSGKGLGSRKFDDFADETRTAFEGNTTPWSRMSLAQLERKLDQAGSDFVLLQTGAVKRIIWFGTEELPTSGLGGQLRIALQESGIEYWVVYP